MLSPVEGVLVSVNHEVLKNPNLIVDDPYKNGWLCVIKAPEMSTNVKNLLQGPIVLAVDAEQPGPHGEPWCSS